MKKISKEEWFKLSPEEREHRKLEYSKDVWKFKKKLFIVSRVIAIMLILAIVWIGYIQMMYVQDLRDLQEKHGNNIWCYMCGLKGGKSCECVYYNDIELENLNMSNELLKLAENNIQKCKRSLTGLDRVNNINLSELPSFNTSVG